MVGARHRLLLWPLLCSLRLLNLLAARRLRTPFLNFALPLSARNFVPRCCRELPSRALAKPGISNFLSFLGNSLFTYALFELFYISLDLVLRDLSAPLDLVDVVLVLIRRL